MLKSTLLPLMEETTHQLRSVVYPIIYKFYTSQVVIAEFINSIICQGQTCLLIFIPRCCCQTTPGDKSGKSLSRGDSADFTVCLLVITILFNGFFGGMDLGTSEGGATKLQHVLRINSLDIVISCLILLYYLETANCCFEC